MKKEKKTTKKSVKIASIILASVLAVSAAGIGTVAAMQKNLSDEVAGIMYYTKDDGTMGERKSLTESDNIITISKEATEKATDPDAKTVKLYESKIKPMLINYFDSIGVDVKDKVNSLEMKIAELPTTLEGVYFSGNTIYLSDMLFSDAFVYSDPSVTVTEKDNIIHTMIHESIHALGFGPTEEMESSSIEEAITEYLTEQVYEFNNLSTDNFDYLSSYYNIKQFIYQVVMISPTFIQDHFKNGYNYLDEFFGENKDTIDEAMTNYYTHFTNHKYIKAYQKVVADYIENNYTGDSDSIHNYDIA